MVRWSSSPTTKSLRRWFIKQHNILAEDKLPSFPALPKKGGKKPQKKEVKVKEEEKKEDKKDGPKRGQRGKLKKIKEKYKDQDEDERLYKMGLLQVHSLEGTSGAFCVSYSTGGVRQRARSSLGCVLTVSALNDPFSSGGEQNEGIEKSAEEGRETRQE